MKAGFFACALGLAVAGATFAQDVIPPMLSDTRSATDADREAVVRVIETLAQALSYSPDQVSGFERYARAARFHLALVQQCAVFNMVFGSEGPGWEALARAASLAESYDPELDLALEVMLRMGATLGTVRAIQDYADRRLAAGDFDARMKEYLVKAPFRTPAEGVAFRLVTAEQLRSQMWETLKK